jgi:hypothetical protein
MTENLTYNENFPLKGHSRTFIKDHVYSASILLYWQHTTVTGYLMMASSISAQVIA